MINNCAKRIVYIAICFVIMNSAFILHCCYAQESYDKIVKKCEKALEKISSYHLSIVAKTYPEKQPNNGTTAELSMDFVKPSLSKIVKKDDYSNRRDTYLFYGNKKYIFIPVYNKWSETPDSGKIEKLAEIGELEIMINMMKNEKPSSVEETVLEDIPYTVLTFSNSKGWGDITKNFSDYTSTFRFYIDKNTDRIKMTTSTVSGKFSLYDNRLIVAEQRNIFTSYNDKLDIAPPKEDEIFKSEIKADEGQVQCYKPTKLVEFKSKEFGVSLRYPSEWYLRDHSNNNVCQVNISREKIEKPGDIYLVGISIMKFMDSKSILKTKSDNPEEVCKEFMTNYIKNIDTSETVITMSFMHPVKLKDTIAYITGVTFKDRWYKWITVDAVLAHKDNQFVWISMEAPQEEYIKYGKFFYELLPNIEVFGK